MNYIKSTIKSYFLKSLYAMHYLYSLSTPLGISKAPDVVRGMSRSLPEVIKHVHNFWNLKVCTEFRQCVTKNECAPVGENISTTPIILSIRISLIVTFNNREFSFKPNSCLYILCPMS